LLVLRSGRCEADPHLEEHVDRVRDAVRAFEVEGMVRGRGRPVVTLASLAPRDGFVVGRDRTQPERVRADELALVGEHSGRR
jgi:hypothetical protein